MPRFLAVHTCEGEALTTEEIERFEDAALEDPRILGYRSSAAENPGQCLMCIIEASDKDAVAAWFTNLGFHADRIDPVKALKPQAREAAI